MQCSTNAKTRKKLDIFPRPDEGKKHGDCRSLIFPNSREKIYLKIEHKCRQLRRGFRAEDALEAGAGELDADDVFAGAGRRGDVHDAALCGEVGFVVTAGVMAVRDADFEVRTDGHIKARDKRSAAAA